MANHFVDFTNGNDGNSGVDMDNAWKTLQYAIQSGSLTAGDKIWWRRGANEIPTSDINPTYDGTTGNPLYFIGCPRNTASMTQADWTNGSTTVDNVVGLTLARDQHQARYVTGPDGEIYFITRIVDSNTFILDREYSGSTVTGASGAADISADKDYAEFAAIDDTGWTITVADWLADADTISNIDFNDGAFQWTPNADNNHVFRNIEFKDSTDTAGMFRIINSVIWTFENCLFKQTTANIYIFRVERMILNLIACTLEGSGSGATQRGIDSFTGSYGIVFAKDCAIYNFGDIGIYIGGYMDLENVNIGVEIANGDYDIELAGGKIVCRDVKMGGTNGLVSIDSPLSEALFENYQKILGEHRTFYIGGYYEKVAVSGETPNKKVSDYVLKFTPNINAEPIEGISLPVFEHEIDSDTSSLTYKYWIYNDSGVTLNSSTAKDDIWLKLEYISQYDDTSEYIIAREYSTETNIADAADADDWDYLQISSIAPATASKVRISLMYKKYLAATNVFVDPAVVIS